MENKELLEQIAVGQVVLLSKLIDMEKKAGGSHRVGGDYMREAVKLLREKTPEALRLLSETR